MEAACSSETSADLQHNTCCSIQEDITLYAKYYFAVEDLEEWGILLMWVKMCS
jgi:hypothetical protein